MFKKTGRARQRNLFLYYFTVFAVVILIPILLFCVFFSVSLVSRMRREAYSSLQNGIQAIQTHFDHFLKQLEGDATRSALELEANELMTIPLTTEQRMRALAQLRKQLETTCSTNSAIESAGVYFLSGHTVLSEKGYYPLAQFGQQAQIIALRGADRVSGIHVLWDEAGHASLFVASCVPIVYQRNKDFLYFTLDEQEMRRQLQGTWQGGACMLLDNQGRVILHSNGEELPAAEPDAAFALSQGAAEGLYYATTDSAYVPWRYVLTLDRDEALAGMRRLLLVIGLLMLALFGLGILFSYLLAGILYRPIGQIVHLAKGQLSRLRAKDVAMHGGELAFLNEAMESFGAYSLALERALDTGRARVLASTLRHLMEGQRIAGDELDEIFDSYAFSLPGPRYLVLALTLDTDDAAERSSVARYQLAQHMQSALAPASLGELLLVELGKGRLGAVVSHDDPAEEPLKGALESMLCHIAHAYARSVRMGVSPSFTDREALPVHCSQALSALARLPATQAETIWAYELPQEGPPVQREEQDWPQLFLPALLATDEAAVSDAVSAWAAWGAADHTRTAVELQTQILQITGYVLHTLRERRQTLRIALSTSLLGRIQHAFSPDSLVQCLRDACDEILDAVREDLRRRNGSRMVRAVAYINEHFREDVSLSHVADMLEITPQHLSSTFKSEVGVNFTEYVNGRRMQEACQLLRSTRKSVQWIAEQIGYHSVQYFTRKFKDVYGVSPTQYRDGQG